MTREQAWQIEESHNVVIDTESEMYTHGLAGDEYGWQPVPDSWLTEIKGEQG